MGTITPRKRADGSIGYTVQIRIRRDGKLVHSESETFSEHATAKEYKRRRESELDKQRARGEPIGKRMTIAAMVEWYEGRETDKWGRTKKSDLAKLKAGSLADKRSDKLTKQDFIAHIEQRRREGAGPATATNDVIWLRQVFKSANAVMGVPVPLAALNEASDFLRSEGTIAKPNKRDRRLRSNEEARLLEYLDARTGSIPHGTIMRFAILTARRQEEITRLLWSDLDKENGVALLRDVKHPTKKKGNHKHFRVLSEAWAIIEAQPKTDPRIFPYDAKSIGAMFTNACKALEIEDLHFHDLRHEATSRLFEKGYSITEVAQFTLHESWATLKRYTHLKPQDVKER